MIAVYSNCAVGDPSELASHLSFRILLPRRLSSPLHHRKYTANNAVREHRRHGRCRRPQVVPSSWREHEALQMAEYEDKVTYGKVMDKLSKVPGLVHSAEVDRLHELSSPRLRAARSSSSRVVTAPSASSTARAIASTRICG